jgi:hypothetical protein
VHHLPAAAAGAGEEAVGAAGAYTPLAGSNCPLKTRDWPSAENRNERTTEALAATPAYVNLS